LFRSLSFVALGDGNPDGLTHELMGDFAGRDHFAARPGNSPALEADPELFPRIQ